MALNDWIFSTLHAAYQDGQRSVDQAANLIKHGYRESKTPASSSIPLQRRLSYLRQGYNSRVEFQYDLDAYDIDDYLPDYSGAITPGSIAGSSATLSSEKHAFYRLLQPMHDDAIPDIYGLLRHGRVIAATGDTLSDDPIEWVTECLSNTRRLVCKPVDGWGSDDVHVIEHRRDGTIIDNGKKATVEKIVDGLSETRTYLVMAFVEQADYANTIYPDATHTIRFLTLQDPDTGEPFIAHAIHRIGTDASAPVDDWERRGLSVGIDLDTGEFTTVAQKLSNGRLNWIESHPDTGEQITGTAIPNWDRVCEKTLAMARQVHELPLIAWDITLDETGVNVLEGNTTPNHEMMQIHKPLLTDDRTRRFFEHHGVI